MRIFRRKDFESLVRVMNCIKDQLNEKLPEDITFFCNFLVELELFVHFKCSFYFSNLFHEFNGLNIEEYFSVLDNFITIEGSLTAIHLILASYNIKLILFDLEVIKLVPAFLLIPLSELNKQMT